MAYSRKSSRKASRASSRKASRKASRSHSRKSSRQTKASCGKSQQWMSSYKRADGVRVKGHCHTPRKASRASSRKASRAASRASSRKASRKASRASSRKASRKGSRGKKSLPPQLRQMSSIVKSLAKSGDYSGNIMKAAAKIYRSSRR